MAGYTSRILLTFSIPFFGFVLWFLKKKKNSNSVSSRSTQIEDSTSSALFDRQIFEFDLTLHKNKENSCEDQSTMQLKETQTSESQNESVSQQNGISQDNIQQNGVSQNCAQELSDTQAVLLNDVPQLNGQHNGVSNNVKSTDISQDSVPSNLLENNLPESKSSSDCVQQNSVQDKNCSSNSVHQNGASQKSVQQNGTQQNGTSKGKKKKSKGREKLNTSPTDIVSADESLHLEDEIQLVKRIEAVDLKSVSAKDELLNVINKNEMENANDTNSDLKSNTCVNGDTNQPAVEKEEITRETANDMHVTDERNSNETESLQAEMSTDPCTSLILPIHNVSLLQINGEMIGSPGASYCDSLGSTDSGRGASEAHISPTQESAVLLSYAFEIPQKLVGLLIGRLGKNVNFIKQKTNADILIKRHPTNNQNKICLITGTEDEINAALRKIREKFPPERFPNVTLSQICFLPYMPCPENLMLRLPEGSLFDVMLSATVTAGHFFLQQPTHPTFHSLVSLTCQMTEMYNQDLTAPSLPHMEKGFICAANLSNCWYRAEIDEVFYESDECRVKYLDYGGYSILPRAALKQINYQFMNVPFQASECYLGLVIPPEGETEWSDQATAYFEELAQGQILQGFIVAYAETGIPYVQLYRITGVEHIDINLELVQKGHARYIKPQAVA